MQGKASDEAATTGTATPRSGATGATVSAKSSAGGLGSPGRSDGGHTDTGGGGSAGGSGGKRKRGGTAGGAGVSRQELQDMPTARVKRILANRQSAARSKERKLAYIGELESQVSTLTMQLTQASMQLRSLQQDTASLGECNQALAQQALVLREHMAQRDAETTALVSELQSARALLAAHDIPVGGPGGGGGRRSPFPNGIPSLAAGSASTLHSSSALLMAHAAAEGFQLPASAMVAAASEGFGAAPDALRLGEGFGGGGAASGIPGLSNDLVQRAQLQALERHQAQQRLWANSVGSTVDPGHSPGASPRGGDPPGAGGHPGHPGAGGSGAFSAGSLLAAQQQLMAAAHAANAAKDGRLPAGDFMGNTPGLGMGLGAGSASGSLGLGLSGFGGGGSGSGRNGRGHGRPSADTNYYPHDS